MREYQKSFEKKKKKSEAFWRSVGIRFEEIAPKIVKDHKIDRKFKRDQYHKYGEQFKYFDHDSIKINFEKENRVEFIDEIYESMAYVFKNMKIYIFRCYDEPT